MRYVEHNSRFEDFLCPIDRHVFPAPVEAGTPFLDSYEEQAYNHPFVIAAIG
jgi:hypothetical protein